MFFNNIFNFENQNINQKLQLLTEQIKHFLIKIKLEFNNTKITV